MENGTPGIEGSGGAGRARLVTSLPRWKKVLLTIAGCLVVGGFLLKGVSSMSGDDPVRPGGTGGPSQMSGNLVGPGSGTRPPSDTARVDERPASDWSPAMLRGGFGFFAGFSIGLALRTFFRLTAIVIGFNLGILLLMSYFGWVDVRWEVMETQFNEWTGRLGDEMSEFKSFVAGSLPTAGLSSLGLFTGFRRR